MASAMLNGAENITLFRGIAPTPKGLGFLGSDFHGKHFPKLTSVSCGRISARPGKNKTLVTNCSLSASRPASQPRFIQHKKEAFWFYRFLSIVYDHVINPGHWTEDMRDEALEPADLNNRKLTVVDVGGGTGFTTLGIVKHVDAKNVTILDQSPHQLAKAKKKEPLKECKIIEGDAEDLPFPTDYADRYISAGSIEYWPDPQRGIREAYRVLRLGGKACVIGPVYPTFWLSRFFADVWMLFPKEEEYIEWFTKAGFKDVQLKRIGPKWYRGVRRHGLIMGCSVTGVKPASGDSPLQLGPKAEDVSEPVNPFVFLARFLLGAMAASYYVLVPIYMWIKDLIVPKVRVTFSSSCLNSVCGSMGKCPCSFAARINICTWLFKVQTWLDQFSPEISSIFFGAL
ncbi:2-methyl-6-phytyl-1,4-hydroquinone methyltransferase, chloroplastic [Sesamum angolense]|uniref:2-methyl-6-phytyl-1,4-hydroquinone methyltransferase, chloroplastic n=1 Tax=Sesamum angolense TaxID=2727404 RepID=A0AAE1X8J2_9LAMI|nr:2-methyl-6-phytyl-1,4-hydroquinone methyltransferase, chloroplastic [Sesamum angolense]